MSRNLTNAASFDVGIVLDRRRRQRATKAQHGGELEAAVTKLADWIVKPEQVVSTSALLDEMARTVRRVRWMPRPALKMLRFGRSAFVRIEDPGPDPMAIREEEQRLLVVSPFLGAGRLKRLTGRPARRAPACWFRPMSSFRRLGRAALGRFGRIFEFEPEIGFDTPTEDRR